MADLNDGITSITNTLANQRAATAANYFASSWALSAIEARAMYRTGLGRKIVHLKSSYALNDTLQFEDEDEAEIYAKQIERHVRRAAEMMLVFGRALIVLVEPGQDLSKPRGSAPPAKGARLQVFSGDQVSVQSVSLDLMDPLYLRPVSYHVRGHQIHPSRVVDFVYAPPCDEDLPMYQYGGISEFELIHAQMINDGIVERASATIIEKNSTLFIHVKGFRDAIAAGKDNELIEFMTRLASLRSIYGDGILDAEDKIAEVKQTLTDLASVDQITLRRLAMVTGIPLALLVGESVQGLNATGKQERQSFQDMIEALQFDHLTEPIQRVCALWGLTGAADWADNQGGTAADRIAFEATVLANARIMMELGEDYHEYLQRYGLVSAESAAPDAEPEPDPEEPPDAEA